MDPVDADGVEPLPPAPPAAALRVLVVDDCPAVLRFVERALAGAGHVVACHDDPRAALASYQAAGNQIDLVITDYSMPHLNGLQLVEAMRAARAGGAFLMITADGPPLTDQALRARGIGQLLRKPFSGADLRAAVQAVWAGALES